jgi:hypothetical protein
MSDNDGLLTAQPTALSEPEEKQFQNWIKNTGWYKEFVNEYGEEPELNIPDYDYRAVLLTLPYLLTWLEPEPRNEGA